MIYRQGDVLLLAVEEVPEHWDPVPIRVQESVLLAMGEATGHSHRLVGSRLEACEVEKDTYVRVGRAGAALRHEEHREIEVVEGIYRVIRQREYSGGEASPVQD